MQHSKHQKKITQVLPVECPRVALIFGLEFINRPQQQVQYCIGSGVIPVEQDVDSGLCLMVLPNFILERGVSEQPVHPLTISTLSM